MHVQGSFKTLDSYFIVGMMNCVKDFPAILVNFLYLSKDDMLACMVQCHVLTYVK